MEGTNWVVSGLGILACLKNFLKVSIKKYKYRRVRKMDLAMIQPCSVGVPAWGIPTVRREHRGANDSSKGAQPLAHSVPTPGAVSTV